MKVVFQARFVFSFSDPFGRHGHVAGSWLEDFPDEVEYGEHRSLVAVGTIVGACFAIDVACLEDAWKGFAGHADAGVCFSVFEEDVVSRFVFFDEAVFKE